MARVAADMCAGKPELFAEKVDEQRAGLDQGLDLAPVDRHFDLNLRHFFLRSVLSQTSARNLARSIARRTVTPVIFLRYSAGPCPSEAGLVMASAALAAFAMAVRSILVPTSAWAAASAQRGVSATFVRPIEAARHVPFVIVSITAA